MSKRRNELKARSSHVSEEKPKRALSDLAVLLQNPIHRANRAEVGSLVQKRSPHLSGRLVDEPLTVQGPGDFLALSFVESSVRPRTTLRFGRHRLAPAIQRGTSHNPEPRRLPPFAQSAPPAPRPPRSVVLVALEWIQGGSPVVRRFFFGSPTSSPPEPGDVGVGRSRARAP